MYNELYVVDLIAGIPGLDKKLTRLANFASCGEGLMALKAITQFNERIAHWSEKDQRAIRWLYSLEVV